MLKKIKEIKLKKFVLKKGNVLRALKKKDKFFYGFEEVYFSMIKKNQVKGWKKHNKMKMNLIVPIGKVEFKFYSEKENKFRKIIIGEKNYRRIFVPEGIWFAFKGHNKINLIMNISNKIHSKKEVSTKKLKELKFND